MRIGVPKESAEGERRVALVPEVVKKLVAKGHEVVVEGGAGEAALVPDAPVRRRGRDHRRPVGRRGGRQGRAARPPRSSAGCRAGQTLIGFLNPRGNPDGLQAVARDGRDGVRDGGDPADLARAVDGRAELAVQRLGLQVRAAGRRARHALLPDADDRGGHDPAGQGAGAGHRRRRACRRWPPRGASARRPRATTCAPRRPSRSSRWAPSGWTSASRPPARAATRAS